MKIIPLCVIQLLIIHLACAQSKQVLPRDESNLDPSLSIFVNELRSAISNKDENWIFSKLDNEVTSTFGDEPGIESFKRYWTPENDSTDFWPYLSRVVELGGVFLHDTADQTGKYQFVFPYLYDTDLFMDDDFYELGVVTGENVNLRFAPDTKSKVVRQLSHEVIRFVSEVELHPDAISQNQYGDPAWYLVTTYDKKNRGWVNWQYLAAPYGPRLFLFKDKMGHWMISAFVAGD